MRISNLLIQISMDNNPSAELVFSSGFLWGYPDLVKKLFEEVRPVMVGAREKRREREEAEQQEATADDDSLHLVPKVVGQDEDRDNTRSVPSRSSQPASPGDGIEYITTAQTDRHRDSQTQPDGHPLTGERPLLTASGSTEVMQPSSGDPNSQPDVPGVADKPDENDEVPSELLGKVDDPPPFGNEPKDNLVIERTSPHAGMDRIIDPDARSALILTAQSDAQQVSQLQAIDSPSVSNGYQSLAEGSNTMDMPIPAPSLRPDTAGIAEELNLRTEIEVGSSAVDEDPYRESGEQEEWLEK